MEQFRRAAQVEFQLVARPVGLHRSRVVFEDFARLVHSQRDLVPASPALVGSERQRPLRPKPTPVGASSSTSYSYPSIKRQVKGADCAWLLNWTICELHELKSLGQHLPSRLMRTRHVGGLASNRGSELAVSVTAAIKFQPGFDLAGQLRLPGSTEQLDGLLCRSDGIVEPAGSGAVTWQASSMI